jgi:hypothetical protein
MTVGSVGLLNGEYIRNTVNGRIDLMPNPHPSGDFGIYFDLTTSSDYAIVGTIDSAGGFNTNSGFQFANTIAVAAGKYADFVILDQDIMKVPEEMVLKTSVMATYLGGRLVYGK